MKIRIVDKTMQNYFKYLGIANTIFYLVYLIGSKISNIGLSDIIFIAISSISMVLIPVLYLIIMTKKEKLQTIHMYMNIIIVTICFDILLLGIEKEFSFIYLIKSILISIVIFTPIRIIIANIMDIIMCIPNKLIRKRGV